MVVAVGVTGGELTLDSQVFLQQVVVLVLVQQRGQSSYEQLHLHAPGPALSHVEASLVHLPQGNLEERTYHHALQ